MTEPLTVFDYAYLILTTNCVIKKSQLSIECYEKYKSNTIKMGNPQKAKNPPIRPARPLNVNTVAPNKVSKRGKGGSHKNRLGNICYDTF